MRFLKTAIMLGSLMVTSIAVAQTIEDFEAKPETRWIYFADTVMGGVSQGGVQFLTEGEQSFARIKGEVSTDNNGGFIQIRASFGGSIPENTSGLTLRVRGNGERYYIHLRTRGSRMPWQYYQASFPTTDEWTEVSIPFSGFKPSGGLLRNKLRPSGLRTIGIVAYGKNHFAELDVNSVALYQEM